MADDEAAAVDDGGGPAATDDGAEPAPATADGNGETLAETGGDESDTQDAAASLSIADAREAGIEAASSLLDHDVDGVVRVERTDDGWRVLVEVVERSAVPDTQDILGRYEVLVDDGGTVLEYGLLERYRRGETREEL